MIKAPLYNLKGEKLSDITLPKAIFETEVVPQIIAQSIRVYLNNQRSAHAKVKDVGGVAGTTKKMWAQKGTGRARHGSSKFGLFVGGASAHGPQGNQSFAIALNQKTKKLALNSLLSQFAQTKNILIIDDFKDLEPKTKKAAIIIDLLEKNNQTLAKSKKIGIITDAADKNVIRAFRNIAGFSLLSLKSLNTLDLSKQNFLIFSQQAVAAMK
jgi:large subunit ribosomal protein L4